MLVRRFAAYRFPASLDYPTYPGHKKDAPYTLRHQLTLFTRAILLQTLALAVGYPGVMRAWVAFVEADSASGASDGDEGEAHLSLPKGVRLFAPKVLAVPDKLSQDEYDALLPRLCEHWRKLMFVCGPNAEGGSARFATMCQAVKQIRIQAGICPELLDYTGDE